jgi:hypothetical protein
VRNCASCHLLHMGSHIDLSLVVILVWFHCMLCEQATWVATMLICEINVHKVGIWGV